MELFEKIRREYFEGVGTILGVAQKLGVHRRTVREAIRTALPPKRKKVLRESDADCGSGVVPAGSFGGGSTGTAETATHRTTAIYQRVRAELPEQGVRPLAYGAQYRSGNNNAKWSEPRPTSASTMRQAAKGRRIGTKLTPISLASA